MNPERQVFQDLQAFIVRNKAILQERKELISKAYTAFFEDHPEIVDLKFDGVILWAYEKDKEPYTAYHAIDEKLVKCMRIFESLLYQLS